MPNVGVKGYLHYLACFLPYRVLAVCIFIELFSGTGCHRQESLANASAYKIVSAEGEQISAFFIGLPVDRRFIAVNFYAERDRQMRECRKPDKNPGVLAKLVTLEVPAEAAHS